MYISMLKNELLHYCSSIYSKLIIEDCELPITCNCNEESPEGDCN